MIDDAASLAQSGGGRLPASLCRLCNIDQWVKYMGVFTSSPPITTTRRFSSFIILYEFWKAAQVLKYLELSNVSPFPLFIRNVNKIHSRRIQSSPMHIQQLSLCPLFLGFPLPSICAHSYIDFSLNLDFLLLFLVMCMRVCLCGYRHRNAGVWEARGARSPGTGVTGLTRCRYWEPNSGPLKEQFAF